MNTTATATASDRMARTDARRDGIVLPLRELTAETPTSQPSDLLAVEPLSAPESPRLLPQDVERRIADRTGRRIRALIIELTDHELIVRGTATCYYLKQLALHAALEALHCNREAPVTLRFEVIVVPPARLSSPGQPARRDLDHASLSDE